MVTTKHTPILPSLLCGMAWWCVGATEYAQALEDKGRAAGDVDTCVYCIALHLLPYPHCCSSAAGPPCR